MKHSLYIKMALNNIKREYRFYIPHILTGTGMLACFYIVLTLAQDEKLSQVKGGRTLPAFMAIGAVVMALLSLIIMLYAGSFLMKQRKKELGLYSLLGMERRHIKRVLRYETLFSGLISIFSGLALGALMYKLCVLLICRLLKAEALMGFYYLKPTGFIFPALYFALIYCVSYLKNCLTLRKLKPVEIMNQSRSGEREPKIKWALLILGAISLAAGYIIALSVDKPIDALEWFFIAVILVIIGTYFLFVAGSIFILKTLRKNKRFYYRKNHMNVISGLMFRMKQNAVGLASIAILATGVMIMLSTTVSLYSGLYESVKSTYAHDMYIKIGLYGEAGQLPMAGDELKNVINEAAELSGTEISEMSELEYIEVTYRANGNALTSDYGNWASSSKIVSFTVVTGDTFSRQTGASLELNAGEVAIAPLNDGAKNLFVFEDMLSIDGNDFRIAERLPQAEIYNSLKSINPCVALIVSDDNEFARVYEIQLASYQGGASSISHRYMIDFADEAKAQANMDIFYDNFYNAFQLLHLDEIGYNGGYSYSLDDVWTALNQGYEMYGAFLFLGIILSVVCMFSTVLIIYHKQVSEGYEDRGRYQIMQKVGMSTGEVKRAIKAQTLAVFFLPLAAAALHMLNAFGLLSKLMVLFELQSHAQFVWCTIITFLAFSLVYVIIYRLTARTYYKIVH